MTKFVVNKKDSDALTFIQHLEDYSHQYFSNHQLDRYLGDPYLSSTSLLFVILLTDHALLKIQNIEISNPDIAFNIDNIFQLSLSSIKRSNYNYLAVKTKYFLKQPIDDIALLFRRIYKMDDKNNLQIIRAYNDFNICRFKKCLAIVDENNYRNAWDPLFKAMHDSSK